MHTGYRLTCPQFKYIIIFYNQVDLIRLFAKFTYVISARPGILSLAVPNLVVENFYL